MEDSIKWQAKTVQVADLKPYEKNPRKISLADYQKLLDSLRQDGYHQRILATPDLRVIGGHQRIRALKELGIADIEVLIPDREIGEEQFHRILVRDNLAFGGWEIKQLGELMGIGELKELGMPAQFLPVAAPAAIAGEDDAPEPPAQPVSALGDVWSLGRHRLMCGDATNPELLQKLLAGEAAELVFTDPPYRMDAEGGSNQPIGRAAAKLGDAIKHLCDFDPMAFLAALPGVFGKRSMNAYIFCNKDLVPDYLNWAMAAGYAFNILFWKKPNAIPLGKQHRPDVEYLLFFRRNAPWNNAIEGVSYSKCLEHARENSTPHPTMKPVAMIENQVMISSSENGLVLDPFGGSGSTLIACEKTGRRAALMELDPAYCDVIITRWQLFTGQQATLEASGQTFAERSAA
jgi:DNA modification methylase